MTRHLRLASKAPKTRVSDEIVLGRKAHVVKRALAAGWRRQSGMRPGGGTPDQVNVPTGHTLVGIKPTAAFCCINFGETTMQITINVPDWIAHDLEARRKKPLDADLVETALRVYYMELVAPVLFPEQWPHQTKVAVYGDM